MNKVFLFSVDLEDVRDMIPDGNSYKEAVPKLTQKYLDFLNKNNAKATFFVVGDVARKYPELINKIYNEGHEIACHSDKHIHLTDFSKEEFRKDLEENIKALKNCGVDNINGYRAPTFSLNKKCSWAYGVLKECGINYSSSVLPAHNPLFGWPEFGRENKMMNDVLEIPVTLSQFPGLNVPFCGGVYFRVLPFFLIKKFFIQTIENGPVLNYLHPYDIDLDQEKFMHPHLNNSLFYNYLMYFNRKNVFNRLQKLLDISGACIYRYDEYIKNHI